MPFSGLTQQPVLQASAFIILMLLPTCLNSATGVQAAVQSNHLGRIGKDEVKPMVSDLSLSGQGDRVLMLQNGAVFEGEIEKSDGKWKIKLANNATMIFQNYQVRVVADSIEDIYLFQSQKTSQYDVQQKAEMVRWCLANKLIPQAERELSELNRLRIDPGLKKNLQVQLQVLKNPTASAKPTMLNLNATKADSQNRVLGAKQAQNPIVVAGIREANHNSPLTPRPNRTSQPLNISSANQREVPVSTVFKIYDVPGLKNPSQVQKAIDRQLPEDSLQAFSQSTHQVVIEACGSCHFQDNADMRSEIEFDLQLATGASSVESVRYNLQQIMGLLNRENPGNSELLEIALNPHGGMKKPVVVPESAAQQSLVNWVYSTQLGSTKQKGDLPRGGSRVQLAGAEMVDGGKTVGNSEPPVRLIPAKNSANPYDPTAFNQQAATNRYQLPTVGQTQSLEEMLGASNLNNTALTGEPNVASENGGVERLPTNIASPLPRPTSMFSLRTPKSEAKPTAGIQAQQSSN